MSITGPLKVTPISLEEYRGRIRQLPMPTLIQAHAFAEKISGAHSWYKHLNVTKAYEGFVFYLDPNAGKDVWWDEQQGMRIVSREPEDRPLHYSWCTTSAATEQFAYLNYCRVRASGQESTLQLSAAPWITDGEQAHVVPQEVLKASWVECTALLHPHSQSLRHVFRLPNFKMLIDADIDSDQYSKEEKRLIEIIRVCNEDLYQTYSLQDEFASIVMANRDKQLSDIVKAINRLRDILS